MTADVPAPVPFVDLGAIHAPIQTTMLDAINRVVSTEHYIMGPEVAAFEAEVAAFLNVPHAIGVSSGTDALVAALMALGIGQGDEVITTSFTFVATAGSIVRLGATPVFVDIERDSFNLDVEAVAAAVTPRTKAIVAVHLFGRSVDMTALGAVAAAAGVPVIEDAAQSIGAEWDGVRVGGLGAIGCFSFFPAKNLGALGDGGLVTTTDDALADTLRCLRTHGSRRKYFYDAIGGNFRLDAMQAAVLRVKLPHLEDWTAQRQDHAQYYLEAFRPLGLDDVLHLPDPGVGRHVWNQFVVRAPGRRDELQAALREARVGCAVYYPKPLHLQPAFQSLAYGPGSLPESERACLEVLALPIAPGLTRAGQDRVVEVIADTLS